MSARRRLWTGPYSAVLRDRAVARGGGDLGGIWIVATPMARDQLVELIGRRRPEPTRPLVYCWEDLWAEIAARHPKPPGLLPEAARRSALIAAIGRAARSERLGPLERVADLPGTRKALAARFATWTLAGRRRDQGPPRVDDITRAEWGVYSYYLAILARDRVTDAPGRGAWAARALGDRTFGESPSITILDPVAPSRPQLDVVAWAARVGGSVLITLPTSGDPHGDDPAIAPLRSSLGDAGFEERAFGPARSTELARLEMTLFDDEADETLGPVDGLSIVGGPKGEGLGLVLAREVASRIEAGATPDDLLVVVPKWDDDATRALEILGTWGIPASGGGRRTLASDPAIAALRLAIEVAEEWETAPLIRLLRNGQLEPRWGDLGRREALFEAASTIQSLRVFRGHRALEGALDRPIEHRSDADRAQRARSILDRLGPALDLLGDPAPWADLTDRLRRLATTLGLDRGSDALDTLWDALDDHAMFLDPDRPLGLAVFAKSVGAISGEVDISRNGHRSGTVRIATVAEAEGATARTVLVTNLSEGSFPDRHAVSVNPDDEEGSFGEPLPFAREKLRFLRLLAAGRDEVVLLVPTADEKGQELLPAGFVDDVRRRIGAETDESRLSRIDPVFRSHPELARAPGDARVLAVAGACLDRSTSGLIALARDPGHRSALEGAAAGLRLVHERLRIRKFTEFDGLLRDPKLVERLAAEFGPDHTFSPSQIESFALCPFQFYQRYVLKIAPVDDRPELRVDHAGHGQWLHAHLEEIHAAIVAEGPGVDPLGRLDALISTRMAVDLDLGDDGPGEVADGLRAIESELLRRGLDGYRREFHAYRAGDGAEARPSHFELRFGPPREGEDSPPGYPPLVIGPEDGQVRLSGMIDRIDLLGDGDGFRIIDYKTGPAPGTSEVTKSLRAVQLPIYALAAEQFLFDGHPPDDCDFGYWTLGRRGYTRVKLTGDDTWPSLRERVIAEVVRLAGMLRVGEFRVDPKRDHCTRSCDYQYVCRIGQIRFVGKV